MVFTGTFEHTIDSKNRLAIPSEIRSQVQREVGIGEGDPICLVVTIGIGRSLSLYTEAGFEQRARELKGLAADRQKLNAFRRVIFSLSQRQELDRQGRLLLPAEMLRRTGLGGQVVLIGVDDHLEVRDRDEWRREVDAVLMDSDDLF
ncbi:MAG: hypothetical protein IT445_04470 [Phycisphaeraceae bacterium]|nr:hypothetical protein [Phycisphaeraceae bacterium]